MYHMQENTWDYEYNTIRSTQRVGGDAYASFLFLFTHEWVLVAFWLHIKNRGWIIMGRKKEWQYNRVNLSTKEDKWGWKIMNHWCELFEMLMKGGFSSLAIFSYTLYAVFFRYVFSCVIRILLTHTIKFHSSHQWCNC